MVGPWPWVLATLSQKISGATQIGPKYFFASAHIAIKKFLSQLKSRQKKFGAYPIGPKIFV